MGNIPIKNKISYESSKKCRKITEFGSGCGEEDGADVVDKKE